MLIGIHRSYLVPRGTLPSNPSPEEATLAEVVRAKAVQTVRDTRAAVMSPHAPAPRQGCNHSAPPIFTPLKRCGDCSVLLPGGDSVPSFAKGTRRPFQQLTVQFV